MSDAADFFKQFMRLVAETYDKVSPILNAPPEVRGRTMAMACAEDEIVLACWRDDADNIQYTVVKGEDIIQAHIDSLATARFDFVVIPVLSATEGHAAKEAYKIFSAAPEVIQ